jgi:hypothetical protein
VEQVAQIAASIRGWTNPVPIDRQDGSIAGYGRVLAAGKCQRFWFRGIQPDRKDT